MIDVSWQYKGMMMKVLESRNYNDSGVVEYHYPSINHITLGSDPEFELVNSHGEIVYAKDNVKLEHKGTGANDVFGVDGAGGPVECRPQWSTTGTGVMENLKKIIKQFHIDYPMHNLSVRGDKYAIGCHIHIGVGCPVWTTKPLLKLTDDFVALPMKELNGLQRGSYGLLTCYRKQDWGYEYRACPSAITATPDIFATALDIGKGVFQYFLTHENAQYNEIPTVDDYVRITGISAERAKAYLEFPNKYNTVMTPKKILANWIIESAPVKPIPVVSNVPITIPGAIIGNYGGRPEISVLEGQVVFKDDWNMEIVSKLTEKFKRYINNHIVSRRLPFKVCMYGMRQDRGMVSTISIKGVAKKVTIPELRNANGLNVNDNTFYIGMPWGLRMESEMYTDGLESKVFKHIKDVLIYQCPSMRLEGYQTNNTLYGNSADGIIAINQLNENRGY